MEELKKINKIVSRKQVARLVGGIGCVFGSVVLLGRYIYQQGIFNYQKYLGETYPEEYKSITQKVCEVFEKNE